MLEDPWNMKHELPEANFNAKSFEFLIASIKNH